MDKGDYFNCRKVNLDQVKFTPDLLGQLPKELAVRYQVLPVSSDEVALSIAMSDPSDLDAIDALHFLLQKEIEVMIADEQQIQSYVQRLYETN